MNVLFVNYGDFTTNSLNHIGGFANTLCRRGHACAVAVPFRPETVDSLPSALFIPVAFAKALERPHLFPDGRGPDIIHAWTPREWVREFVVAYQAKLEKPARLIVHLEDNEAYLIEAFTGLSIEELLRLPETERARRLSGALSHPLRRENLLRLADAVTVIEERLREHVPPDTPTHLLLPGLDPAFVAPLRPDPALRGELGIGPDERVITFTGSTSFASEPEIRELYLAVARLNELGHPTRLIRTGYSSPQFRDSLPSAVARHVIDLGIIEKHRLPGLLALADALVQPGRPGPFNDYRLPSKLPEFLASGRPVVTPASNLGLRLRDGEHALILRHGTPEEIADACQRLFTDPDLAARLGREGRAYALAHFDLEKNTGDLLRLYEAASGRPSLARWQDLGDSGASDVALLLARTLPSDTVPATVLEQVHLLEQTAAELLPLRKQRENLAATQEHVGNLEKQLESTRQHAANLEYQLKTSRQHASNLAHQLEATLQHAANLEKHLTATREHADDLTHRLEASERNLKDTLQHAANLEKILEAVREQLATQGREFAAVIQRFQHDIAVLNQAIQDNRTTIARLQQERESLSRLAADRAETIAERDRAIQQREQEIDQLRQVIAQREDKIRRMQASFSWRATAPLRALRRTFVDKPAAARPPRQTTPPANHQDAPAETDAPPGPAQSHPVPSDAFLHVVDTPRAWTDLEARHLKIEGWVLEKSGRRISAVRARVAETAHEGAYGHRRVDVAAAMPDNPLAAESGFAITARLEGEAGTLLLEARLADGTWHPFFAADYTLAPDATDTPPDPYQRWMKNSEDFSPETLAALRADAEARENPPRISVVMPVYNTPEKWLRRAIESVREQTWPHWELCIADDASPEPHVRAVLEEAAAADSRIRIAFRKTNGHISAASNTALELATGEWIALLDHDDELAPNALQEVADLIRDHPDTDFIYSDEDKIDEQGVRSSPYFKPDFLPDLFTAQNYTTHFAVYRAALVREVGGFREGFEGSQDWDLALRIVEKTEPARIRHIPKILYHWRSIPGSTARNLGEKDYPVLAARRALAEHFERLGQPVTLHEVPGGHWRVQYPVPEPAPLVSLIIPTHNRVDLLRRCVESIREKTTYPHYEIIIVDNRSDDPDTLEWLESVATEEIETIQPEETGGSDGASPSTLARDSEAKDRLVTSAATGSAGHSIRVLRDNSPFNYSALNNRAVARARGEYVGLLNNDLELITPGWLEEMVAQAARPEIGCVGAMLYYPDDTIQHAGVVLGIGGVAGHAFKRFPRGTEGVFNRARLVQNYSAVTAACLVVRKAIYEQVGGLGEKKLAVAFNDIDFCLKVRAAGYRNLWTPFAEFYHHESASRGYEDTPEKHDRFRREIETMLERWGDVLQHDPAYNPNLTLKTEDFAIAGVEKLRTMAAAR